MLLMTSNVTFSSGLVDLADTGSELDNLYSIAGAVMERQRQSCENRRDDP